MFCVPRRYLNILFTASQCTHPGLSKNWATVDTANAISGRVPIAAYINEPTASRYGTFHIRAISASFVGDWDFESGALGSIGTADGFKSVKL